MSSIDSAGAAARKAARRVGDAVDDMQAKGQEAADRASDAASAVKAAFDDAIRTRPYTMLMAAGAIGFLYAVLRGRS